MSYQLAERLSNHNMMNGSVVCVCVCVEESRAEGAVAPSGKLLQPPALAKSMLRFIGGVQVFSEAAVQRPALCFLLHVTQQLEPLNETM